MPSAPDVTADAENEAVRALMCKVTVALRPVLGRLVDGQYELLAAPVTLDEVRKVVFAATGSTVSEIVLVRSDDLMARTEPLLYRRTLDRGIESLFGFRLLTHLGNRRWGQHRRHFGYDAVIPLEARLAFDPRRLPWENLRSAMFHFFGFAFARQEHLLKRLDPLVELLPRAIPLGELVDRPGVWEVMVA